MPIAVCGKCDGLHRTARAPSRHRRAARSIARSMLPVGDVRTGHRRGVGDRGTRHGDQGCEGAPAGGENANVCSDSDCERSASIALPRRSHSVPPKCSGGGANLSSRLRLGGIGRNACTRSRRLIARRSQVQIVPPLLRKALETGPFCSLGGYAAQEGRRPGFESRRLHRFAGCMSAKRGVTLNPET